MNLTEHYLVLVLEMSMVMYLELYLVQQLEYYLEHVTEMQTVRLLVVVKEHL